MDASAIKIIQALAVVESQANKLSELDYNTVILPEAHKLESLERFNSEPLRFRGHYATQSIDEYIRYINENGTADSVVFIDQDDMTAKSILDMGLPDRPQWGSHKASLKLVKTPEYAALLKWDNQALLQQDLIDFAEDWEKFITFWDIENNMLDFKKTINTLRKIKVSANAETEQKVGNYAAGRSTLEQVEIKAGQDELPAWFTFTCKPFDGFNHQLFTCQLRAIHNADKVIIKYRIMQLSAVENEITNEFKALLQGQIDADGVTVYLGNMTYQQ